MMTISDHLAGARLAMTTCALTEETAEIASMPAIKEQAIPGSNRIEALSGIAAIALMVIALMVAALMIDTAAQAIATDTMAVAETWATSEIDKTCEPNATRETCGAQAMRGGAATIATATTTAAIATADECRFPKTTCCNGDRCPPKKATTLRKCRAKPMKWPGQDETCANHRETEELPIASLSTGVEASIPAHSTSKTSLWDTQSTNATSRNPLLTRSKLEVVGDHKQARVLPATTQECPKMHGHAPDAKTLMA